MRSIINSFFVSFSMYSVVPMPMVGWQGYNIKYVFSFFPLVGVLIGGIEVLWYLISAHIGLGTSIYAAIAAIIPIIISGGIHMDGYIDTCDASASRADIDKKAEILKDPHTGAFGVIYAIVYFIILYGALSEFYIREGSLVFLTFSFILSRAIGAVASVNITPARKSGLLYTFSGSADKVFTNISLAAYCLAGLIVAVYISPIFALLSISAVAIWSTVCYRLCIKLFGGISGDLAGFYIQTSELLFIILSVFAFGVSL